MHLVSLARGFSPVIHRGGLEKETVLNGFGSEEPLLTALKRGANEMQASVLPVLRHVFVCRANIA
jgi:hypothetical protein